MTYQNIVKDIQKLANPNLVKDYLRFFKTGKGQYGEGDQFIGVKVGPLRQIAKKYKDISLNELQKLIKSKIHEHRTVVLAILTLKYLKADNTGKKNIYQFYLKNTAYINNWDLVDISAPKIVGTYLLDKNRSVLYKLARSKDLWEKRIAIISTFAFIRENDFEDTIKISEILLKDEHDLIHKAVGWALREVGKKDQALLEKFLNKHVKQMPRTSLRYSIEKFDESKRQYFLKK